MAFPSLSPTMSSLPFYLTLSSSTSVLGSLQRADIRSRLESGPGALRGGGGECGVFAQTEDRRWVHRNDGWERVQVCGIKERPRVAM